MRQVGQVENGLEPRLCTTPTPLLKTYFAKDLWGRDLSIVEIDLPCGDDEKERRPLIASRRDELFLDYLVYKATMPIAHFSIRHTTAQ